MAPRCALEPAERPRRALDQTWRGLGQCTRPGAAASTSTVTDVGGDLSPAWSVALSVTVVAPLAVSGSSRGSLRPAPLRRAGWPIVLPIRYRSAKPPPPPGR